MRISVTAGFRTTPSTVCFRGVVQERGRKRNERYGRLTSSYNPTAMPLPIPWKHALSHLISTHVHTTYRANKASRRGVRSMRVITESGSVFLRELAAGGRDMIISANKREILDLLPYCRMVGRDARWLHTATATSFPRERESHILHPKTRYEMHQWLALCIYDTKSSVKWKRFAFIYFRIIRKHYGNDNRFIRKDFITNLAEYCD
jgi:hypothetical protein